MVSLRMVLPDVLDRLNEMNEAQAESMSMAIHEIVESF